MFVLIIRLAPLALEAVYADQECDCQRIALSQGWTTVFVNSTSAPEQPAYGLFVTKDTPFSNTNISNSTTNSTTHQDKKKDPTSSSSSRGEIVVAIRGTLTIQDIVTDIRTAPQRIPPDAEDIDSAFSGKYRKMRARSDKFTVDSEKESTTTVDGELGEEFLTVKLSQWEWSSSMGSITYGCTGTAIIIRILLLFVGWW